MRRFGLIGFPLEHSFSSRYFAEKFANESIEGCTYENFPIQSITHLPELLEKNPDICGLNVTVPYKQSVLRYLNSTTKLPSGLPACNCIKIIDGKLHGFNTDVIGFEKSLKPLLRSEHLQALVLGGGGGAVAVIHVLGKLGIKTIVAGRKNKPGIDLLMEDINPEIIHQHKLIVNTTPVGMFPNEKESIDLPYEAISSQHVCFDLIYNPERTKFLLQSETMGATVKNGMEMLMIQAEESWRIWNSPA